MTNKPITPPRRGYSALDDVRDNFPDVYAKVLKVKHDTPQNFRDGHEAKKKPFRADDPFPKGKH